MKIKIKKKPRKFEVGVNQKTLISDVAKIYLKPNEQVTFVTNDLGEHDITRKDWGFYATQSINFRLKKFFKTALIQNREKRIYLVVIDKKKIKEFNKYCKQENLQIYLWLDKIKI